ncbi:MauE/DoxX family redox-associated membrane protein [Sphaerimonospora mesophila]|uniref:MauE/DoxX family redox-associated membrane protein n=1 Tax=Sphaerimonospora mesophila TaxID=37483 RepID=UPI000A663CF9
MWEPIEVYGLLFSRVVVGIIFGMAVLAKARDLSAFENAMVELIRLPSRYSRLVALVVMAGESAAAALMFGNTLLLSLGFGLASTLLLAFTIALIMALLQKRRVSCGCFGSHSRSISFYDVIRNVGVLGCALLGTFLLSLGSGSGGGILEGVIASTIAAIFVTLLLHLREIVLLAQPMPGTSTPSTPGDR